MSSRRVVLIVGASLAGVATAEALRNLDPECRIVLLGDEQHLPYDRPPLSKAALYEPDFDWSTLDLQPAEWYRDNDVELHVGRAVQLDWQAQQVRTSDGASFAYDELVVATGSRERRLHGVDPGSRVLHLRNWEDAARLRGRLHEPGRLLVIGAGFIGLEVAASAHALNWQVTLLERSDAPLSRVLPRSVAERCWQPYEEAGVGLTTDSTVVAIDESEDGVLVRLVDGSELTGDLALVCTGGVPNTEWVDSTGAMAGGVPCDAWGQSGFAHVSAVGDVARWHNELTGTAERVEQWQAAKEHADIVAARLSGLATPGWREPLYFWSDLLGGRIQFLGTADPQGQEFTLDLGVHKSLTLLGDGHRLSGLFAMGFPRGIARGRRLVAEQATWADALEWASTLSAPVPGRR